MSKFVRIFLIIVLLLSGCIQKTDPIPDNNDFLHVSDPMPKPQGQSVSYPSTYDVLTVNPITVHYFDIHGEVIVRGTYVKIDGLIDTDVENKINDEIMNEITNMYRYRDREAAPAYRGMDTRIPLTLTKAKSIVIYTYVTYNQNRILSIMINADIQFEQEKTIYSYSVSEGLNFDLNTGNRLSLSDVLTDDADIPKLLLPLIHKQLFWSNDYESDDYNPYLPEIVAPFTEIRGSQNFYLDESGIILVFDMDTPELDTKLQPFRIPLYYPELGSNVALAHRFDLDSVIFESEVIEKRFFLKEISNLVSSSVKVQESNPLIESSSFYEEGLSSLYIDKVKAEVLRIRPFIQEALTMLPTVKRAKVTVSVSSVHTYTVISTWMVAYQLSNVVNEEPDGEWNVDDVGPRVSIEDYEVYDKNNKQLTLKNLFVAGYDYEGLVSYRLKEALNMLKLDVETYHAPLLRNLSFRLSADSIEFFASAIVDHDIKSVRFSIPYREIHAKNLTIFD